MSVLQAAVFSPCSGTQELQSITTNAWGGPVGDFAYGAVVLNASQTGFLLVVTDLTSGSSCFPSRTFEQDNPSSTDPQGQYGNGSASVVLV